MGDWGHPMFAFNTKCQKVWLYVEQQPVDSEFHSWHLHAQTQAKLYVVKIQCMETSVLLPLVLAVEAVKWIASYLEKLNRFSSFRPRDVFLVKLPDDPPFFRPSVFTLESRPGILCSSTAIFPALMSHLSCCRCLMPPSLSLLSSVLSPRATPLSSDGDVMGSACAEESDGAFCDAADVE